MSNRWPLAARKAARLLREADMATATITRIDAGQTGAVSIDWLARADAIAGEIAEAAARHDADESFVSEGYQRLNEEGFFKALVPAELGAAASPRAAAQPRSPSRCT